MFVLLRRRRCAVCPMLRGTCYMEYHTTLSLVYLLKSKITHTPRVNSKVVLKIGHPLGRFLFERSEFLIGTPHKKKMRVCPRARVKKTWF